MNKSLSDYGENDNMQHELVVVDLFAGCGGLSLGATMSGLEVSLAVEIDKWAAESYQVNFPNSEVLCKDIMQISDEVIEALLPNGIDILLGGPPCQGFSQANINKDPKDPRNTLFSEFLRFAKLTSPKICIMENVKGLLNSKNQDGKKVIEIITNEFSNLGYQVQYKILDAADFGVPQNRERLFVVATKEQGVSFSWPKATHSEDSLQQKIIEFCKLKPHVTLGDAISDLPLVTVESQQNYYSSEPKCEYQKIMREDFNGEISHHIPMKHTKRIIQRFKEISVGQGESSVNLDNKPSKRGKPREKSEKTYSQNHRRLSSEKPSNTIPASSHSNFIHPYLHRNFTVRELMRIQSFPDTFTLRGKRAVLSRSLSIKKGYIDDLHLDQRQQIGNAVPPLLARSIISAAKEYLKESDLS